MKELLGLISLLLLALLLYTCDAEKKDKQITASTEDSELALLMRSIHEDAKAIRQVIKQKQDGHDPLSDFDFILAATPTKDNVQGPEFEAMARYYLQKNAQLLEDLDQVSYNEMVESCVACHQSFCPGPIKTIQKLYIN
jgi:hypothetical protein